MREQQKVPSMKVTEFEDADSYVLKNGSDGYGLKNGTGSAQLKKSNGRPGGSEGFITIKGNVYIFVNVDFDDIIK